MNFANDPTATAPAQTVTITDQLDPNLDWSTFQLGDIGFGTITISVPPGRTSFNTRVDATATLGVYVDVSANFNIQTGMVTWTFMSLDPTTLDLPINPLEGFLPPNINAPAGQGFVTYTVQPKTTLVTGTQINAQATVVFDTNAPINTAPQFNTIDSGPPTSSVNPLPDTEPPTFPISWSGSDDPGGSGVASYSIYVSDNGAPFTPFLADTTQTSATFTGQVGHRYSFYSIATDNVGNVQPVPTITQTTMVVSGTVYVDPSFTGSGDPATDPGLGLTVGVNAFSTITAGLANVAPGGTLVIFGGTYSEPSVNFNVPLSAIDIATNPSDSPVNPTVTIGNAVTLSTSDDLRPARAWPTGTGTSHAANLTFGSTVDGPGGMTVIGTAALTFNGPVGGSTALSSLTDSRRQHHLRRRRQPGQDHGRPELQQLVSLSMPPPPPSTSAGRIPTSTTASRVARATP